MRYDIARAMDDALERFPGVEDEYGRLIGRRYGAMEPVMCRDADIVLLTSGTVTSTARLVVKNLRKKGEKVGLLKMRLLRPFPVNELRKVLKGAKKIAVIDRNFSFGASGIFAQEIRAALCNLPKHPTVFGYVAGIGGRDVTPAIIEEIYWKTKKNKSPEKESIWIGLKEVSNAARRQ
jgi:pyruvate/2-oxoacid:ferredoxin oxidoreductase alpha subunit